MTSTRYSRVGTFARVAPCVAPLARFGQLYDDVLAPSGLRATQYTLLTQIHKNNGLPMKKLALSMVMDL